jgi:hypothetical protein
VKLGRTRQAAASHRSRRVSVSVVVLVLVVAVAAAGCATAGGASCRADEKPRVSDTLYFGAVRPDGMVAAADWSRFLEEWVTPRFPEGLTVWQASGQWRGADGKIVEEPSRVLNLVHSGDDADERKVNEISSEYKRQFQQEAVLRTRGNVCVSF